MIKKIKSRLFKWFKVLLFAAVVLVTLGALVLVVERWRAEKAWKQMQQVISERGEPLTWQDLAGAGIPDEENFAMTPLLRPLGKYTIDYSNTNGPIIWNDPDAMRPVSLRLPPPPRHDNEDGSDGRVDFEAWRKAFEDDDGFDLSGANRTAAEGILLALKKYDHELAEISDASRRPYLQYVRDEDALYAGVAFKLLGSFKSWALLLDLRSSALLETGNADQAFEDVQTILRLAELLEAEPLLITQLAEIAMSSISVRSFWQGWADHHWSQAQLEWFQTYFSVRDIRQIVPKTYMGERTIMNLVLGGLPGVQSESGKNRDSNVFNRVILLRNQVAIFRLYNVIIDSVNESLVSDVPLFKDNRIITELAEIPQMNTDDVLSPGAAIFSYFRHPYSSMAAMLAPSVVPALSKFDRAQVTIDLTATVCALERYWLEHGEYPDDLASLVPTYISDIPRDLMDGQPLRYMKRDDGWFDLYSVGENKKDDGGVYVQAPIGEGESDYLWPLPIPQKGPRFL